jgi:hypothetical protein
MHWLPPARMIFRQEQGPRESTNHRTTVSSCCCQEAAEPQQPQQPEMRRRVYRARDQICSSNSRGRKSKADNSNMHSKIVIGKKTVLALPEPITIKLLTHANPAFLGCLFHRTARKLHGILVEVVANTCGSRSLGVWRGSSPGRSMSLPVMKILRRGPERRDAIHSPGKGLGGLDELPGRDAERLGVGSAVVLGQDLAEVAGPVRDGAVADLTARDR